MIVSSVFLAAILGLSGTPSGAFPENPASVPTLVAQPEPPIRVAAYRRTTLIPRTCGSLDGSYDVLIHFHGVETAVEPSYNHSGLNSVLAIVNLGEFSGPYEDKFADGGSLTRLLGDIEQTVHRHCPAQHMGRVALSAWSGGYGAVYRILMRSDEANRVDAVLLADGLHAGFTNVSSRSINALQMAPFLRFSEQAAQGHKLLAITHTHIGTSYASTTETADYLIQRNGLSRTSPKVSGTRPGMTLTSVAKQNGFMVFGYAGNGRRDHCDQLLAIGDTLFPLLRDYWRYAQPAALPVDSETRLTAQQLSSRWSAQPASLGTRTTINPLIQTPSRAKSRKLAGWPDRFHGYQEPDPGVREAENPKGYVPVRLPRLPSQPGDGSDAAEERSNAQNRDSFLPELPS